MNTLLIPVTSEMSQKIDQLIQLGVASNKTDLVRKAIDKFIADEAVKVVLKADQEVKDKKVFHGNLDDLAKIL